MFLSFGCFISLELKELSNLRKLELMFSFTTYKLLVIIFLLNRLTGYHTERNPTAITVTNISNKSIHRTLTG